MSWQAAIIHLANFLFLPLFMGCIVGAFARIIYFKHCPYLLLMIAGFFGTLTGLIAGWIITGHDGHLLNYALALLACTCSIFIASGLPKKKNTTKNKQHK